MKEKKKKNKHTVSHEFNSQCSLHNFFFDTDDKMGCPVCYGIAIERKRAVRLMKKWLKDDHGDFSIYLNKLKNGKYRK